jgi:hypothetical protein
MNNTPTTERPWIAGAVLIGIGLLLLVVQLFKPTDTDWIVLGGLSIMFIAFYVGTRKYGFIVPAMILGGLALGLGFEDAGYGLRGSAVVLGLAAGFLAIYVVSALTGAAAAWWPLIPGGILAVVGGSQLVGGTAAEALVATWWPIVLIAVGAFVLFAGRQQVSRGTAPKTQQ